MLTFLDVGKFILIPSLRDKSEIHLEVDLCNPLLLEPYLALSSFPHTALHPFLSNHATIFKANIISGQFLLLHFLHWAKITPVPDLGYVQYEI